MPKCFKRLRHWCRSVSYHVFGAEVSRDTSKCLETLQHRCRSVLWSKCPVASTSLPDGVKEVGVWRLHAGNVVSVIVFWPAHNELLTATSFLLICLAIIDNVMLSFYYLLIGMNTFCIFYHTCQHYMKVRSSFTNPSLHGSYLPSGPT